MRINGYRTATAGLALLAMVAAGSVAGVGPVRASDDDGRCGPVAAGDWMSVADITAKAEAAGYTVREVERDDGCYEIKATAADGRRVEVRMHPATGAVVRVDDD